MCRKRHSLPHSTRSTSLHFTTPHLASPRFTSLPLQVLKLPRLHRIVREFEIALQPDAIADYTAEWEQMRRIRVQVRIRVNAAIM